MNKNQTWRRVLSLLCAMVMLVGMMVVGTVVASADEANTTYTVGDGLTLAQAMAECNKAAGNYTVKLTADNAEEFTFYQNAGVNITIDGNGKTFTGKITLGEGAGNLVVTNATLTPSNASAQTFVLSGSTAPDITIKGCTLKNTGTKGAIVWGQASYTATKVSVLNCTASNLRYIVGTNQAGAAHIYVDGVTATNMAYLIRPMKAPKVEVKNVTYSGLTFIEITSSNACTLTLEGVTANTTQLAPFLVNAPDAGVVPAPYMIQLGSGVNFSFKGTAYEDNSWVLTENSSCSYKIENIAEPVAQIGEETYTSLQAALNAAVDGNTVKLIADVTLDKTIVESTHNYNTFLLVEGKEITLDLNGKTITVNPSESGTNNSFLEAVLFLGKGANVTLTGNGTIDVKKSTGDAIYSLFYNADSSLVVKNGTYKVEETATAGSIFYADKENHTVIEGGNYTLGNEGSGDPVNGYKPWISNVHGKNSSDADYIIYMGGTFNQDPLMNRGTARDCEVDIPDNYTVVDNGDGTWTVIKAVAQVNGKIYSSLANAIAGATEGDIVELLADVNENVTVGKKLTIDGRGKNYTGTMTVKNVTFTVQNLNFVKGNLYKNKNTGSNAAYITVKNCNFDGQGLNAYAINLGGTKSIVIDTVTATDYGYGLLQVPSTCAGLTVKNVEISNCYYGIKVDYANYVTLENVVIDSTVTLGIYDSNYGTKTYTITGCKLNAATPIKLWQRNTTIYTTFKFVGTNEANGLYANSSYMRFELAEGATVKAAADTADFTTKVADYVAVYHAGSYVLTHKVGLTGELKLGNTIDVYFGVTDADLSNAISVFVGDVELVKNANGKYVFAGLTAKQMADELTVVVKFSDGTAVSEVKTFSIKAYAEAIINGEYSKEAKNLAIAMLHYGEAAQKAFGYNENVDLIDGPNVADVAPENTYDDPMNYYYGASLNLNNGIQFNFKFYADRLAAAGATTVKVTDENDNVLAEAALADLAVDTKYQYYKVTVLPVDLSGANYGSLLTCTFYDANGEVVTYCADSVLGYCARALANAPETGKFNKAFYQTLANYVDTVSKYGK